MMVADVILSLAAPVATGEIVVRHVDFAFEMAHQLSGI